MAVLRHVMSPAGMARRTRLRPRGHRPGLLVVVSGQVAQDETRRTGRCRGPGGAGGGRFSRTWAAAWRRLAPASATWSKFGHLRPGHRLPARGAARLAMLVIDTARPPASTAFAGPSRAVRARLPDRGGGLGPGELGNP